MNKTKLILLLAMLGLGIGMQAQSFSVDTAQSVLKWDVRKVSGKGHYGTVGIKSGKFEIKDNKLKSGKLVVDMETVVNTDGKDGLPNARLVNHLKSDDFFSVAKFPTAQFTLTGSEAFENGQAKIYGRITIKGITQPITFIAKKEGMTLSSQFKIDRSLFDVRYGSGKFFNDLGDNMINDEFDVDISLVLK